MTAEMRLGLEAAGIEVESVLERFMGNEMLLLRFMKKFLEDSNFQSLKEALEKEDGEEALRASHTLKGVCGNLSMKNLFDLLTRQVALLRENRMEEAREMMEDITFSYEKICDAIRKCES